MKPTVEVPISTRQRNHGLDPDYVVFFRALLPTAVSVARRITASQAAAEDAAAEALAKAYLSWSRLSGLDHREAWVLRVTINEAIGTVRKESRRERILQRQPPAPPQASPIDTERVLAAHVARLPRRQREVVTLRYYAELSTEEVASALGIARGSVKSHLHRALHTLRQQLGPDALEGTLQ